MIKHQCTRIITHSPGVISFCADGSHYLPASEELKKWLRKTWIFQELVKLAGLEEAEHGFHGWASDPHCSVCLKNIETVSYQDLVSELGSELADHLFYHRFGNCTKCTCKSS